MADEHNSRDAERIGDCIMRLSDIRRMIANIERQIKEGKTAAGMALKFSCDEMRLVCCALDARDAALRNARAEIRKLRDLLQGASQERDKWFGLACDAKIPPDRKAG